MTLHDSIYYAIQEDIEFFNSATAGLPKREPDEPYHCGPQCVRAFIYAVGTIKERFIPSFGNLNSVVNRNGHSGPVRVLEIGFNLGHSASCLLELGCEVDSLEIRTDERVKHSAYILSDVYNGHTLINRPDFKGLNPDPYDLAFIDGAHDYDSVIKDIQLCREHGITRFLFDDWYPHHGPGVQPAVFDAGLLPLSIVGSMAYCVDPKEHGYIKLPEIV